VLAAIRDGAESNLYEVATKHESCDLWWRWVSTDVIPPIPELTVVLSASAPPLWSSELPCGLCQVDLEDGESVAGLMPVYEGEYFGKCVYRNTDGKIGVRDGGAFFVMHAREEAAGCTPTAEEQVMLASALKGLLDAHISAADRSLLARISGHSFKKLQVKTLALDSCTLGQILSPLRFIPHELNVYGLTMLRSLLAERMADARRKARGLDQHKDYATFSRDGVLLKDLDSLDDAGIIELLQMMAGEILPADADQASVIPRGIRWIDRNTTHEDKDPQYQLHVDTFRYPSSCCCS
jgi:hypothetical protein